MIQTNISTNDTEDDTMGRKAPVTGSGDGPPREVPPEGNYLAVCNGVYMLGTQPGYENGEAREQVMLSFELHKRKGPARDSNDRIFEASAIMSNTFNIKSTLVKYAGAMRGAAYDEAELEELKEQGGFDVETLLGLPCRLSLKHEKKADGKTIRDKIESVSRLDLEDDVLPTAETDEVYWDWTTGVECPKRIAWFWDRAAENPKAGKGKAAVNGNPSHVEAVDADVPF